MNIQTQNTFSILLPGHSVAYQIKENDKERVQYFYRTPDGFLFQTVEDTLQKAESVKDAWYKQYRRRRFRALFGR